MAMVLAKLDRARFHADEFDAKWDWYYRSGAYRYNMRMDEQSPHVLRFWWDLPDRTAEQARAVSDLSFIYGDMLSNLRGTLDYLVGQLVLLAGNTVTDRTGFPAAKSQQAWMTATGRDIRGVDPRWVDVIDSLQPYHDALPERHLLTVLDHSNNISKHRRIPASIESMKGFSVGYSHPDMDGRNFRFWEKESGPIVNGEEFFNITVEPPINNPTITRRDPMIRISFTDELDHSDGWDYTNRDLIQWVTDAVARFEPAFMASVP
jgi:hypothetical protein